jgi:hypothetical protein
VHQVGFCLHDYIEMDGQQNVKKRSYYFVCVTLLLLFGNSLYIPSVCGCCLLHTIVCITQAAKFTIYCQLHIHCFSEGVFHFTLLIVWDMFNKHYVSGFYIFLTVRPEAILDLQPTWRTFFTFSMYLFLHLYMFQATSAHHQEGTIVSIRPLV